MKTSLFTLFFIISIILLQSNVFAQEQKFVKTFGGKGSDEGFALIESKDAGYVIAGYTTSYAVGKHDLLITKFNAIGNHLWSTAIGGSGHFNIGSGLVESSDGGYLVIGSSNGFDADSHPMDAVLSKFDSDGKHLWTKTLGGSDNDWGHSIIRTQDGSYILAGKTKSFGAGNFDLFLAKLDPSGNPLWARSLGGNLDDFSSYYGASVIEAADGSIVVAGSTKSFGAGPEEDMILCKLSPDGKHLWTRTLGGRDSDVANSVIESKDGGYVVTGTTKSYGYGSGINNQFLSKFDADGNFLWMTTLTGKYGAYARAVVHASDSGYIVAGGANASDSGKGNTDFILSKFDTSGNHLWTYSLAIGGNQTLDFVKSLIKASDGGYVISGETVVPNQSDIPFVKFGAGGSSCLGSFISTFTTNARPIVNNQDPIIDSLTVTIAGVTPTVTSPSPTVVTICPAEEPVSVFSNKNLIFFTLLLIIMGIILFRQRIRDRVR